MSIEHTAYLLGCVHEHQSSKVKGFAKEQARFAKSVETAIQELGIATIAEEAGRLSPTLAETIADRLSLKYLNIDISQSCQDQIHHRPAQDHDALGNYVSMLEFDPYATAWNQVREYHMFWTVLTHSHTSNCLVIVGSRHVEPLHRLFVGRGQKAVILPESVPHTADK